MYTYNFAEVLQHAILNSCNSTLDHSGTSLHALMLLNCLNELQKICQIFKKLLSKEGTVSLFLMADRDIHSTHACTSTKPYKMQKLLWNVHSGFNAALSKLR